MNQIPTDDQPFDIPFSGPKSGPTPKPNLASQPSKTHFAYWDKAIFQRRPGGNWWMKVQHAGQRRKLSLGTDKKSAAVARARDTYVSILDNGWEVALATLSWAPKRPAGPRPEATVGQFLKEVEKKADLKRETFKGYAVAFRGIVADIFHIEGGREKYDYRKGGRARWVEKIDAIRLAEVTPAKMQEWKRAFIARAGDDPVRLRSTKTSVNSFLRRAMSLFAPGAIKHLSITLPSPLPFEGIAFEPRQSARYRSSIDPAGLAKAAQQELMNDDPPVFLAFLLALGAGLRRIEIDRLEWSAFRWSDHLIRIETTRHFEPKTEHSIGDVQIDPQLMSVFRAHAALTRSSFVIETGGSADLPLTARVRRFADHYRAQTVFERLSAWLRTHGVTARKPIHELRKEFGSMVNRKHGLSAASDQLRHADIGITAAYYIDKPRRATSGLGSLLEKPKRKGKKIVPFKLKDAQPGDSATGLEA